VTGISFHRGPAGEPGRGIIYQGIRVMDEKGVSIGAPMGNLGRGSVYREL